MNKYEAARALGVADADVLEVTDTERGTEVQAADGGRRLVRDDGVYALGDHPATRNLRRWPDTEPAPEPDSSDVDGPSPADSPTLEPAPDDADSVPPGTAEEVLAWVGDDAGRAAAALEAEERRDSPRAVLRTKLRKLAG